MDKFCWIIDLSIMHNMKETKIYINNGEGIRVIDKILGNKKMFFLIQIIWKSFTQ